MRYLARHPGGSSVNEILRDIITDDDLSRPNMDIVSMMDRLISEELELLCTCFLVHSRLNGPEKFYSCHSNLGTFNIGRRITEHPIFISELELFHRDMDILMSCISTEI